eukprot:2060888-Prymnesium_polylepis.1
MTVIIKTSTMSCSPFPLACTTICDVMPPTTRADSLRPRSSLTTTVNAPCCLWTKCRMCSDPKSRTSSQQMPAKRVRSTGSGFGDGAA